MSSSNLLKYVKKNPVLTIALIVFIMLAIWGYVENINGMRNAETNYDYCYHLCQLFDHNSWTIFVFLYAAIGFLTYAHKQYSKWSIWLFYIVALAMILHYFFAGFVFDYVFEHIGSDYMDRLPSLTRDIYGRPLFFVILSFFFMPKIIKDTIKLRQEQELTI